MLLQRTFSTLMLLVGRHEWHSAYQSYPTTIPKVCFISLAWSNSGKMGPLDKNRVSVTIILCYISRLKDNHHYRN